jgi:lipoprotein-anchoring transpeptidase ErfK/SrfK
MEGTRVSGKGVCFRGWRQFAILAAAGTFALMSQTEAAIYYWQDPVPFATAPAPKAKVRRTKASRHGEKKSEIVEKESKPQGPLIISISIAQQKLRIYDANGLFAESPVSTGMPGHPTPMGVFSVIQKQKFHRSNIYSGAPMPFMQRITWSGVAMHAGVLPGHPASHGCIRMPMAFAVKMYGWTKMGARVVVTPGEVTPASFSHPLLATIKVVPQPVAVEETKADVAPVKTPEKPIEANAMPAAPESKIELRSSVGHIAETKAAGEESRASTALKTADASGAVPVALATNATPDGAPASEPAPHPPEVKVTHSEGDSKSAAETNAAKSEVDPNAAKHDEVVSSQEKPASEKSAETEPAKIAGGAVKAIETTSDQSAKPETAPPANEAIKISDAVAQSSPRATAAEAPKNNMAAEAASQKAVDAGNAIAAPPVAQVVPPAPAAETPLKADLKSDFSKAAPAKPNPGFAFQGTGQIAVFVSRKDSKLYIRQNFAPLFQTPVTIAADTRPLGTHIFTAQVDSSDHNALHWSVVSLPVPARASERRADDERPSRGRKFASAGPIEAKPVAVPDGPAEALDRLSLPAEVMAKVYEAVSTGGSIIVSDQGIAAGETGEGTDFIVSLR